jgi:hypothetical protein
MEIKQKIYNDFPPKQRAVAVFLSINRDDSEELDRLLGNAPKNDGHRQAILAIGQALNAYNRFLSDSMCNYLVASRARESARSYCSAWIEAGGALSAPKYLINVAVFERLEPIVEEWENAVYAVRQAAWEWCEKNKVPVGVFSRPVCVFSLPEKLEITSDSEELNAIRSCFDKITLSW